MTSAHTAYDDLFARIVSSAPKGTVIPKPRTDKHIVKGLGCRRGELAIVYTIPNQHKPTQPSEKGVTKSEIEATYAELVRSGVVTRKWFTMNLPECYAEGPCNYTSIGGLLVLIGVARYDVSSCNYKLA